MNQQPLFDLEEYIREVPDDDQQSMFVAYFGEEAAAIIAEKLGGLSIKIPTFQEGKEWDALVSAVGDELAARISDTFGGEKLYIPKEHEAQLAERNRQVRDFCRTLMLQGWQRQQAMNEAAKVFDLSDRHIRRILQ